MNDSRVVAGTGFVECRLVELHMVLEGLGMDCEAGFLMESF